VADLVAVPDAGGGAGCWWRCRMLVAVADLVAVPDAGAGAGCWWRCRMLVAVAVVINKGIR